VPDLLRINERRVLFHLQNVQEKFTYKMLQNLDSTQRGLKRAGDLSYVSFIVSKSDGYHL
jgi:hypothetical protein